MKSVKFNMNTLNCVLLVVVLALVVVCCMKQNTEDFAASGHVKPITSVDLSGLGLDSMATIPTLQRANSEIAPCASFKIGETCNKVGNCLWNRRRNTCDGEILERKAKFYRDGPKEGSRIYNKWEKKNKCGRGCTSTKYRHEKIRNKALNKIDSDNICDLGLCTGCDECGWV